MLRFLLGFGLLSNLVFAQPVNWSLKRCIEHAASNNLNVKRAILNNDLVYENWRQSVGNRIPTVTGVATQNVNFGRSVDPFSNQFVQQQIFSNNFSLNSSLILFNGLQNNELINQNNYNYKAGKLAIEKSKNDLYVSIAGVYLQILLNIEQEKSAIVQKSNTVLQVDRALKFQKAGIFTEANIAQLNAQMALEQLNITNIHNQLINSKVQLCQLLQIEVDTSMQIESILPSELVISPIDSIDVKEIYLSSIKIFPQIKESDLRIAAALAAHRGARGSRMPRLTLNGGLTTIYSSQNKSFPSQEIVPFNSQFENNLSKFVNLQLSFPILTARTISTNIARANINHKISELNKELAANQLRQDVETATINYTNSFQKYQAQVIQLNNRSISFNFAEKRFEAGTINSYDFLNEKNLLLRAELDMLQSKYEVIYRKKLLSFYQGVSLY